MNFAAGRPDMIRAINQRWLLNFWKRSLGTHKMPPWELVETEDLSRFSANISHFEVSAEGRYIIRNHGAMIARVYGKLDCRGKHLDEVIPPDRYAAASAAYQHTVQTACPTYTIHDVPDSAGRVVHFERLLLPFSTDGQSVDRILASFEFVCLDGAYDSNELMKTQPGGPVLRLSATIERTAMT